MSEPFEPQPPANQWNQPPITEIHSSDAAPTGPYAPPPPYAPQPYGTQPYAPQSFEGQPYAPQPYPAAPYPGEWPPATAAPTSSGRRKLPWVLSAAAAVVVLGAGGVSYAAYSKLNGGGTQPDAVTPSTAIGFVKIDLNPSASQKIAASRFLNKLPKSGAMFGSGSDWRQGLFDSVSQSSDFPQGVDFNRDVKPWLGKRMAIAALPSGGDQGDGSDPDALLLLQSTDDAKAKAGIARFDPNAGVDFYKGYALVAKTQPMADQVLTDLKQKGSLASSAQYRSDMSSVGSLGVASGWLNLPELEKGGMTFPGAGAGLADSLQGRVAFTVRFNGKSADLIAKDNGATAAARPAANAAKAIGGLPASTVGALNVSIAKGAIDSKWDQVSSVLDGLSGGDPDEGPLSLLQNEFNLDLPTDLDSLFGDNVTVALDSNGLTDDGSVPKIGVLTHADGQAAAKVMDKITSGVQGLGGDMPLVYKSTSTGFAAATDQDYLDTLTATGGAKLSSLPNFSAALPDLATATSAGFVNLDAITAAMRKAGASADDISMVAAFSSVGFTATADGTFHLRLVAH